MADFDPSSVDNIAEYYEKDLARLRENLDQLYGFHEEYAHVRKTLEDLPSRREHSAMIPLGPKAFMPGVIRHTNEITVLLGADYYVDVTAKYATEIINRRLEAVEGDIKQKQNMLESVSIQLARAYNWFGNDAVDDTTVSSSKKVNVIFSRHSNVSSTKAAMQASANKPSSRPLDASPILSPLQSKHEDQATSLVSTSTQQSLSSFQNKSQIKSKSQSQPQPRQTLVEANPSPLLSSSLSSKITEMPQSSLPKSSFTGLPLQVSSIVNTNIVETTVGRGKNGTGDGVKFTTGMPEINTFSLFKKGITEEGDDMIEIVEHIDDGEDDEVPTRPLAPSQQAPPAYSIGDSDSVASALNLSSSFSTAGSTNSTLDAAGDDEEEEEEEEEIIEVGGGAKAPTSSSRPAYDLNLSTTDVLKLRREQGPAKDEGEVEKAFWDGFQQQLNITSDRSEDAVLDAMYASHTIIENTAQNAKTGSLDSSTSSTKRQVHTTDGKGSVSWAKELEQTTSIPSSSTAKNEDSANDIIDVSTSVSTASDSTSTTRKKTTKGASAFLDIDSSKLRSFWDKLEVLSQDQGSTQPSFNVLEALAQLDAEEEDYEDYYDGGDEALYGFGVYDDESYGDEDYYEEELENITTTRGSEVKTTVPNTSSNTLNVSKTGVSTLESSMATTDTASTAASGETDETPYEYSLAGASSSDGFDVDSDVSGLSPERQYVGSGSTSTSVGNISTSKSIPLKSALKSSATSLSSSLDQTLSQSTGMGHEQTKSVFAQRRLETGGHRTAESAPASSKLHAGSQGGKDPNITEVVEAAKVEETAFTGTVVFKEAKRPPRKGTTTVTKEQITAVPPQSPTSSPLGNLAVRERPARVSDAAGIMKTTETSEAGEPAVKPVSQFKAKRLGF